MHLEQLLRDAVENGLLQLNITRLARGEHWQAASRWTWSSGHRVAIEATPLEAAVKVLEHQSPEAVAAAVPTASVPSVSSADEGGIFG